MQFITFYFKIYVEKIYVSNKYKLNIDKQI